MRNILVTGGYGFIGSNFINYLLNLSPHESYYKKIVNFDKVTYAANSLNLESVSKNSKYSFVNGDICDESLFYKTLIKFDIDAVVNFAAESHVDNSISNPDDFIKTNILGTYKILNAAKLYHSENKKNFLFYHISTDEVYGSLNKDDNAFTEDNQYQPNSPYSASKASSDHLVRAWHHTYKLPVLTSNCSNNYGPFQFPEKLIPLTIINALSGMPISIYGDGLNIRDWLYVTDHCSAIETILHNGKIGEIYNIGGNNEKTNMFIVESICNELEKIRPSFQNPNIKDGSGYFDLIKYVDDRPGHDFRYSIDSSKLSKNLNWVPAESFESGIVKTVKWYVDNQNWIDSTIKK